MADEEIGPRAFIILEDMNYARIDSFQGALELVKQDHAKDPTRRFIIVQLVASVEPVVTTKVTRHF